MRSATPITRVRAATFRVPTDRPEADGTLAWDSTVIVVVHVEAGGMTGLGYTYGAVEAASLVNGTLARHRVSVRKASIGHGIPLATCRKQPSNAV